LKPVRLEVRDEAAAKAAVQLAVDTFGRWTFWSQCRLWAVCALRADECGGLPGDRGHMLLRRGVHNTRRGAGDGKQKSGHIFQVSSVGGRTPFRQYAVSRGQVAVGGFSDSLAMEVAPFGVKVCTLEPGGIRTNWARRAGQNAPDLLPEYEATVGSFLKILRGSKDVRKAIRGKSRT